MKLRVPLGCGAASHDGCTIEIDADGYVYIDAAAAEALALHGFVALSNEEADSDRQVASHSSDTSDDVDGLNRRGLFAYLKAKGVSVSLPVTNEELRALARSAVTAIASNSEDEEV